MKIRSVLRLLWIAACLSWLIPDATADPIRPYQQPIEQQLQTDISGGSGDLNTLNRALNTYHRTSRTLSSDMGILRDLNNLLADQPNYPALLADAANAYLVDFQLRHNVLTEQLRPAPRSSTKTSAQTLLGKIDTSLSNAAVAAGATNTTVEIKHLLKAAGKIPQASNTIQRALRSPIGLSSVVAKFGLLKFASQRGGVTGGSTFQSDPGTAVGEFGSSNGVLTFSAFDNGSIARAIHLHVEGITSNTPATYPLGVGENSAFYDATDVSSRREYHFHCHPGLTNSLVTSSSLTIDFISTNYLLGRFAFIGTNANQLGNRLICVTNQVGGSNVVSCTLKDTNTVVTIHQGEFQLNFSN